MRIDHEQEDWSSPWLTPWHGKTSSLLEPKRKTPQVQAGSEGVDWPWPSPWCWSEWGEQEQREQQEQSRRLTLQFRRVRYCQEKRHERRNS